MDGASACCAWWRRVRGGNLPDRARSRQFPRRFHQCSDTCDRHARALGSPLGACRYSILWFILLCVVLWRAEVFWQGPAERNPFRLSIRCSSDFDQGIDRSGFTWADTGWFHSGAARLVPDRPFKITLGGAYFLARGRAMVLCSKSSNARNMAFRFFLYSPHPPVHCRRWAPPDLLLLSQ